MYAAPQKASVRGASLPKQMLLAFARTVLLQPGDHTTVCMPVDLADLRLMGAGGERFTLQKGRYTLTIGGASPGPAVRLGCLWSLCCFGLMSCGVRVQGRYVGSSATAKSQLEVELAIE